MKERKVSKSTIVMMILFMLIMFGSGFIIGAVYSALNIEPIVITKTVTETEYIYEDLKEISLENFDVSHEYTDEELLDLCTTMQKEDLIVFYENAISYSNVQIRNCQVEIDYLNHLIVLANDDELIELLTVVLESYQEIQDEQISELAYYMEAIDMLNSIQNGDIDFFNDGDSNTETSNSSI